METQSSISTVFKILAIVVNVAVIAIILLFRNKDADDTQATDQKQEPPE